MRNILRPGVVSGLVVAALAFALQGCAVDAGDEADGPVAEAASAEHKSNTTFEGTVAKGSFSCDFGLAPGPLDQVPGIIERDRMYMAARPGMIRKELPIVFDPNTGAVFSGGRYLFDTYEHAQDYLDWVSHDYVLDGVEFLARPLFINPECHAYKVIGLKEFGSMETSQFAYRTERWTVSGRGDSEKELRDRFEDIRDEAQDRGLSAVWLTYSPDEHLVQLVYFSDRVGPVDPNVPDFATLGALAGGPALGDSLAGSNWTKTFDRTQWVLTDWYPAKPGDQGKASLWPNSPPFPAPYCGDGVCEVSRGENGDSCPADCSPQCGNGVCDAGENNQSCSADCPAG